MPSACDVPGQLGSAAAHLWVSLGHQKVKLHVPQTAVTEKARGNPVDHPHPVKHPGGSAPIGPMHTGARSPSPPDPTRGMGLTALPEARVPPQTARQCRRRHPTHRPRRLQKITSKSTWPCFSNCANIHIAKDSPFKPHDSGAASAFSVLRDRHRCGTPARSHGEGDGPAARAPATLLPASAALPGADAAQKSTSRFAVIHICSSAQHHISSATRRQAGRCHTAGDPPRPHSPFAP